MPGLRKPALLSDRVILRRLRANYAERLATREVDARRRSQGCQDPKTAAGLKLIGLASPWKQNSVEYPSKRYELRRRTIARAH